MTEKTTRSKPEGSTKAALEAFERGYTPIPIRDGGKAPYGSAWTHIHWDSAEEVRTAFDGWKAEGAAGIGLSLGEPSGGLIDVDLDHVMSLRLRDHFLPPSVMATGRAGRPKSHRWYLVKDEIPATRRYKMPDNSVSVELRSTGAQTLIPPSVWWSKDKSQPTELYRWEGSAWGGKEGPAVVPGRKLAIQVASLGLGSVLLENWPRTGSRHDAYLALAGGLLRFGDGVHPYWERNLPVLIHAMADASHDDDGGDTRVAETMGTTITKLRENGKAVGFPKLAEIIGTDHAELVRRMAREVESLAGFTGAPIHRMGEESSSASVQIALPFVDEPLMSTLPPQSRNPMEERVNSWAAVDLEPYLAGEVTVPEPSILRRTDGQGLFYPGRVNSLFGLSESAKSWIALEACSQEIGQGDRVIYIDFEDEPAGTLGRALLIGMASDDLKNQFRYVHPEGPIADMQRYRFGAAATDEGLAAASTFRALLDSFDPTLIIADGMTVLYGLHGHDTNEATGTDVITQWLKSICRGGRTGVIVIDHTGKGGGAGSSPIGAHHKVAMIQGTALRADAVDRPMPGAKGTIRLIVYKDRPGAVRAASTKATEQVAAVVTLDSTVEGRTKITVDVPDPDEVVIGDSEGMNLKLAQLSRRAALETDVLNLFGGDIDLELKTSDVTDSLGVSANEVYDVWQSLKDKGLVVQEGATRWTRYHLPVPPTATPIDKDGETND